MSPKKGGTYSPAQKQNKNNKIKRLSDYAQQDVSVATQGPRILDMKKLQSDTDSSLHAVVITLLSRIISQIKLIIMNILATFAKHGKINHAINEITSCHV
jgi:hypothetical protein